MRVCDFKKWLKVFFCDKVFSFMFFLMSLFAILLLLSVIIPINMTNRNLINSDKSTRVDGVYDGHDLAFTFKSIVPDLLGISLYTENEDSLLMDGIVYIKVTDEDGIEIYSGQIPTASIKDTGSIDMLFSEQSDSNAKKYTINISTSGIDNNHAISFEANDHDSTGTTTRVNGVLKTTPLIFSIVYTINSYKYTWYLILLSSFFFVLTIVSYGRNRPRE